MRPVLVIEDRHSSHISMEVTLLAKENDVHLLCLPSHTTHILQPLDVAVFKSLKTHYSIACKSFLSSHPGHVIQSENIASLLGQAWPKALIPINIMSGFKKCGIYPLNPGIGPFTYSYKITAVSFALPTITLGITVSCM